jgi:hypothetical protein
LRCADSVRPHQVVVVVVAAGQRSFAPTERLVDDAHERLAVDLGGGEGIVSANDGQDHAHDALLGGGARVDDEESRSDDESAADVETGSRGGDLGGDFRVLVCGGGGARAAVSGESFETRAESLGGGGVEGVGAVGATRRRSEVRGGGDGGDGGVVDRRTAVVVERGAP